MDDFKPPLREAVKAILERLEAIFPDVDAEELFAFTLYSAPVWRAIGKQVYLTYYLLDSDKEEETE